MENIEKKTPLNDLMDTTMDKIRDMVDSNTIIGEPITTPDGVTVIPVSRVSFGFGAGDFFGYLLFDLAVQSISLLLLVFQVGLQLLLFLV